ncbi:MAG: hypothetical protein HFI11_05830 [Lachnospiraceae bacterium]|nr:hypothetical protein [Lachnospiraceae bacterium]
METGKYLTDQIRRCKRKMNLAKLIDRGILCAAAGGIPGICCELASLLVPFYHVHLAAALCFGAGLLAGAGYAVYRRADMKQAASRLDSFGLKERMLTAYENLDKEDTFAGLQREDAFTHYEQVRGRIKIPLLPDKRHILALVVSAAAVIGMSFIPSPVRDQAKLRHQVQEQAAEENEELEKLLDALQDVDMESLTEQQKAQLQELVDTMELSREELAKADSWESLFAATGRLDYKYQQAAQSLEQLAGQIESPNMAGLAGAEAFAKAAAAQNNPPTASPGTPSGSAGNGNGGEDGDNGSGDGNGDGENNAGGEDGQGGGNNSGDESSQNGKNGSGDGSAQNGNNNGSGNGSGEDGENGSGNGNGQGNGNGSGNGQGNGNGNGQGGGNGSGGGRGTGSSDAAHDYVSIPNATGDDASLTGNKNGAQDSDYYRQQNGLAWEGDHVDYSSVIGEYTDSAYEGIANGKYPSGMESVIRDYFENLNQ